MMAAPGPETLNGYKDGDGCPETDTDVDGIYDDEDHWKNDLRDLDLYMDTDGCPDIDNDGDDGILDVNDKCPNSAEDFDGFDDEDGCPEATADSDGDGILDDVDLCVSEPDPLTSTLMKTAAQIQHPHWFASQTTKSNHQK